MKKSVLFFFCLELFVQAPGRVNQVVAQDSSLRAHSQQFNIKIAEEEFNKAVKKHKEELDSLIDKKTGEPADVFYKKSRSFNPSDTSVRNIAYSIQDSYDKETAVLFYNYEGTTLKIWLLNHNGIRAYHQQEIEQNELERLINELRKGLGIDLLQQSRAPHLRGVEVETANPAKNTNLPAAITQLTSVLLPPSVASQLTPVKALIIVPVLSLGTVPFAILKPFKTNKSLIDRMSISIAPSLFEICPERGEKWSPIFSTSLIVGNPYFTAKALTGWDIPPLPGAEKEAKVISILVNTSVLTGRDATKTAVMTRVPDADFLYFATHGVSDSRNSRMNSFLILSGSDNETGFWTMEEILNQRYKARLAVLSACQTGLGETYKGGIMALGRTFQVAGVPRVVMSLWNVDDNATVYLMEAFVSNLQKNPPSESLRQAMLKTRKKYTDPSKWASFVLFGTPK